jgi:hypothetical protein
VLDTTCGEYRFLRPVSYQKISVTLETDANLFSYTRPEIPYTINVANLPVSVSQSGTQAALSH